MIINKMSRRKRNSSTEEELYENEKEEKGLRKRQQVKYYESSSSEDDYMETVEEKPRLNKKSGNKSRSLGTDDPDFESGDSDPDNKTSSEKKAKSSSRKKETEPLSEYEKQLLENKIKNQEFLKAIGMEEAKNDFIELKPKKFRKKKEYSESSNGPKRVSQREKAHINYTEGEIGVVDIESELTRLTFEKLLKFKNVYEDFVEEFKEILLTDDFVRTPVSYNRDVLKLLSVKATTKVANLISPTTVSWYPSSEHLVLAIGNIAGNVTLWNIEESDYLYKFAVHSKKVSKVQFNPCNTSHLISSSWDGTLLCCDMREQKFTEVLRISNSCCTCFDFFSPSSYLVSLTNGGVVTVDRRVRGRGSDYVHKTYTCHDSVINSIHVHPVEKDYFVTAGRDRKVCIWDSRKLARPIIEDTAYSKNVNSAFFSPLSGKYLLTASVNRFCIFDTEKMTEGKLKLCRGILDKFRDKKLKSTLPVWVPNSDDIFTWQNKESREMLQIYDKDFNEYETVTDGVTGIRETIEFHPFKPAIASVSQNGIIRISAEKTDS